MTASPPTPLPFNTSAFVLVFMKSLGTPLVLYTENVPQLYEEMRQIIRMADAKMPKLLEKQAVGPLKKVSFLDTEVSGVAIQTNP